MFKIILVSLDNVCLGSSWQCSLKLIVRMRSQQFKRVIVKRFKKTSKENAKSADREPCKDRNRLRSHMPAINRTGKKNKPFNWKKEHCIGIGSTCNDKNCFLGIWTKNSGSILLNLGLCLIVFCWLSHPWVNYFHFNFSTFDKVHIFTWT